MPRPLDALLAKTTPGLDTFLTEKYAEEVGAVLNRWAERLLRSPQDLSPLEDSLSPQFSGLSPVPAELRPARQGPVVEAYRSVFSQSQGLGREPFLLALRFLLARYSRLITVEFQVTAIHPVSDTASQLRLRTRIRYEWVGTGTSFYREQRVGYWDLSWNRTTTGDLRLLSWTPVEETVSRSLAPVFEDIAERALGGAPSYAAQLRHGTDYWRTVLDSACGIDIYGHSGVSVGDIDGNGFDDLYVCQPGGLPNRLYRNRGDGTFDDITDTAGVGVLENTACALFVDVDNDGRQDLIVVRTGGPMLFLNQGNHSFRQVPGAFQFATPPQGTFTGAAVADYDRDGWLDIYFCLYIYYQGTDQYKYPSPYYDAENGPPNFLFRNNRNGTFRDVTAESGLDKNNTRYSFCCGWADFDGKGWPDLYVVNDFGRKNLYRNNGNGTFTDIAAQAGVEDVGAGMSVCCFDYNNEGLSDLYVADMWTAAGERISMQPEFQEGAPDASRALYRKHAMGNSLFHNRGKSFTDETASAGVDVGRWAWSSDVWDFDHDGHLDLYIANGMISGPDRTDLNSFFWRQVVAYSPNQPKPSHAYEQGWSAINELIRADRTWSGYERNLLYANNGDGTFSDVSGAAGLDFLEDSRAFAIADFDHDGRQEVFLKNRSGPQLRILKNNASALPPSISFRLRGTKSNRDAIGAVVTLRASAGIQTRLLQAGSGFLSQHSKELFFGLGESGKPVGASIRWPGGLVQELRDLPVNHRVLVEEGSDSVRVEPYRASVPVTSNDTQRQVDDEPDTVETWLLAPVTAPDFELPGDTSNPVRLSSLRGKPVLLNLWAIGAERCREEWEHFRQRHASWAAQGFQLLSVNLDAPDKTESVKQLLRDDRLTFPIAFGTDDTAAVYNILYRYLFDRHRDLALPASFLIDQNGDIVKVYQGPVNPDRIEADSRHIPKSAADRLAAALPFPGITETADFGRNYLSYGSVFFQRGYMDQAAAAFQIALRDESNSAEALYGLGSVYLDQRRPAEARDAFQRTLKLRASFPDTLANTWNNLGLLATREGRHDEAIQDFLEALRLSPDHSIALDNLGSAYRQQKEWEKAESAYDHAIAVNPEDPEANYGLGMVFAQKDDTARAGDLLQRAVRLRPVYPEALNNLGILYLRTQRRDEAVASFEQCIKVAPAFERAYLNLARVRALEGDVEKARSILQELLKQHPESTQARQMLNQLAQ